MVLSESGQPAPPDGALGTSIVKIRPSAMADHCKGIISSLRPTSGTQGNPRPMQAPRLRRPSR